MSIRIRSILIRLYIILPLGIKQVYAMHLYEARLLDQKDVRSEFSRWNVNTLNSQLVLGVLLAGTDLGRVLHYHRGSYYKGILNPDSLAIKTE